MALAGEKTSAELAAAAKTYNPDPVDTGDVRLTAEVSHALTRLRLPQPFVPAAGSSDRKTRGERT